MKKTFTITRWIAGSAATLASVYVLVYVLLSLFGKYRPMSVAGLAHWEIYPVWTPFGSFNSHPPTGSQAAKLGGTWRVWIFQAYYSLWEMDTRYVHKQLNVYKTGYIDETGKWVYTTNSLSPLAVQNDVGSNH